MDSMVTYGVITVGLLAFVTSLIIEVIKELPGLKRVPTMALVILVAQCLTAATVSTAADWQWITQRWSLIPFSIVGGFFVAFVAANGWDKLHEIFKRYSIKH